MECSTKRKERILITYSLYTPLSPLCAYVIETQNLFFETLLTALNLSGRVQVGSRDSMSFLEEMSLVVGSSLCTI